MRRALNPGLPGWNTCPLIACWRVRGARAATSAALTVVFFGAAALLVVLLADPPQPATKPTPRPLNPSRKARRSRSFISLPSGVKRMCCPYQLAIQIRAVRPACGGQQPSRSSTKCAYVSSIDGRRQQLIRQGEADTQQGGSVTGTATARALLRPELLRTCLPQLHSSRRTSVASGCPRRVSSLRIRNSARSRRATSGSTRRKGSVVFAPAAGADQVAVAPDSPAEIV